MYSSKAVYLKEDFIRACIQPNLIYTCLKEVFQDLAWIFFSPFFLLSSSLLKFENTSPKICSRFKIFLIQNGDFLLAAFLYFCWASLCHYAMHLLSTLRAKWFASIFVNFVTIPSQNVSGFFTNLTISVQHSNFRGPWSAVTSWSNLTTVT